CGGSAVRTPAMADRIGSQDGSRDDRETDRGQQPGGHHMGFFGGRKRERRLEDAGVDASAQILAVQDTGMTVNNNPRIKLVLSVAPQDGSAPFEVSKKQLVSRVAVPRAGDVLTVRYDPEDHDNFEIGAA